MINSESKHTGLLLLGRDSEWEELQSPLEPQGTKRPLVQTQAPWCHMRNIQSCPRDVLWDLLLYFDPCFHVTPDNTLNC